MKLREVKIKNFRNLVDVSIPIADTTVLVGENNSGKTALLDSLKIALPRSVGRGSPFDEYDYHMSKISDSPHTSQGIIIELWFREDSADEWPDTLIQSLTDIIQTDPAKDLDSIGLRLSSIYDTIAKEIITKWEFLTFDGQPLGGKGANPANFSRFLSYIRLFNLSALRDSNAEFSPRSQYWGRILRDLKISEEQMKLLTEELAKLNDALLKADTRLEQVRASLDRVQQIISVGTGQKTSIQALPLKPWDLLSKSEVVIKSYGNEVEFPLAKHGQGMQSLAVLFLFEAYIDMLLVSSFQPETKAVLTLEEPEAHLHPQATRALAANLSDVKSQKIISSHSPYFIQEIPFKEIRLFRRNGPCSEVLYVRSSFQADIPSIPALLGFCKDKGPKYEYHDLTSTLILNGKMEEKEYRKLVSFYPGQTKVHTEIKRLQGESLFYLTDDELADLDTYAKRIRGEVLFARAWLLCEGQSEYMLLRFFAALLGRSLDQAGVTVIDFQNNGSPGAFVSLAKAFNIPWIMLADNDSAGEDYVNQIQKRGITITEIKDLARLLPEEGVDFEMFLVKNGFSKEYKQILIERKANLSKGETEKGYHEEIASVIRSDKTGYAIALMEKLRAGKADSSRVPEFLAKVITDIIAKAA